MKQGDNLKLLLLSLCFLAGGVLGCLAAGHWPVSRTAGDFLSEVMKDTVAGPALSRELWVLLRWPVLALAAASLPLTGLTMPALFFLRGFFLSCGISAFETLSSGAGRLSGIVIYGPSCFLALPVFFLLGVDGLRTEDKWKAVRRTAFSISALFLCGILDCRVAPVLLTVLLKLSGNS